MNLIDRDVAAAIAQSVAAQVGELRYNLWFKDNARLEVTDQEVVVGVPNLFFQEWLSSNFLPTLRKATELVTGRKLGVRLVVDGEMFRTLRAREPGQAARLTPYPPPVAAERRQPARRGPTLDEFVVGPCNRMAYTAALEVVRAPTGRFNPLVLYGPVGHGKTHLLRGIAQGAREQHPGLQVLYITSEAFTNSFLEDMRGGRLAAFRQRLRGTDLLLVDDIDFLGSKRATQAELLHTYEALDAAGKQAVLAADRHPRLIAELSDEMVSRLVAGMLCPLETPDLETRVAILEAKCNRLGLAADRDVLEFVAQHLRTNVRELEGAVNCLNVHAELSGVRIDLAAARRALAELLRHTAREVSMKEVEQAVCHTLDIRSEQLRSANRSRAISQPRMLAMYLARKHTGAAYDAIGQHFGGRNHSTVMFAERKVQRWLDESITLLFAGRPWAVTEAVLAIEQRLK